MKGSTFLPSSFRDKTQCGEEQVTKIQSGEKQVIFFHLLKIYFIYRKKTFCSVWPLKTVSLSKAGFHLPLSEGTKNVHILPCICMAKTSQGTHLTCILAEIFHNFLYFFQKKGLKIKISGQRVSPA